MKPKWIQKQWKTLPKTDLENSWKKLKFWAPWPPSKPRKSSWRSRVASIFTKSSFAPHNDFEVQKVIKNRSKIIENSTPNRCQNRYQKKIPKSTKNDSKMTSKMEPKCSKSRSWRLSGIVLGASGPILGQLGPNLGHLGPNLWHFGQFWHHFWPKFSNFDSKITQKTLKKQIINIETS